MGGCIAPFIFSPLTENKGRRIALMLASAITLVGTILQAAAQDEAMFVLARIIMGIGTGGSGITGPVYLSETFPYNWRAWGVGLLNDMYFIGGIVAAGVCLGASNLEDTWSWRIPSLIQSIFSIFCIIIVGLFFLLRSRLGLMRSRFLSFLKAPDGLQIKDTLRKRTKSLPLHTLTVI